MAERLTWDSPGNRAAIERGRAIKAEQDNVLFFIEHLEEEAEREFSWKVYKACKESGAGFVFTSEGIRPVVVPIFIK